MRMIFSVMTGLLVTQSIPPAASLADNELNKILPHFEKHRFPPNSPVSGQSTNIPYRLLKPDPLERGRQYPLVLFLHGAGDRGADNRGQLHALPTLLAQPDYRRKYPCFLVAPQCPTEQRWQDQFDAVLGILELVQHENPIDGRRVYVTGYSMGGFGTWSLAALHPDLFAAAVPVAGGGEVQTAPRLIDLPIWAVHGDADKAVPVSQSREMIAAIRQAGGSPNYTELKDIGHNSWPQAYSEPDGVLSWMFAQKKPWFTFPVDWPIATVVLIDLVVVAWLFKAWRHGRRQGGRKTM